jgi:CheY-like chemotaxis protein
MKKILVVEDHSSFVKQLQVALTEFDEKRELLQLDGVEALQREAKSAEFFDEVEFALVDLELGPGMRAGPQDFDGRDEVLPLIRQRAAWIPIILVSRYINETPLTLPEVSPFGFDAIVEKDFFDVSVAYKKQWNELRKRAAVNRIASLTGRYPRALSVLLAQAKQVKLVYGDQVNNKLKEYDGTLFGELISLIDFNAQKIVLEDIGQGFSGLNVFKLTTDHDDRRTSWLLKVGDSPRKIAAEIECHRKMFRDGLTRHFSVPAFWWVPIVWGNVGAIAYEFEPDTRSFLDIIKAQGVKTALQRVNRMLCEFYRDLSSQTVVPSTVLNRFKEQLLKSGSPRNPMIEALITSQPFRTLDTSLVIGKSCEHGDLHCRNIMVSEKGPVMIDFAHYRSKNDDGVCLFDLAKLVVDIWAFALPRISTNSVLSAAIFDSDEFRSLVPIFSIHHKDTFSDDETQFIKLAVECTLSIYCHYPDVPSERKDEARTALVSVSGT